jgi:hypothetical protein
MNTCWAVAPALASALSLTACDTSAHGRCELAPAQRIALAQGSSFDATAMVAQGPRAFALYSDSTGAWARALAPDGRPEGPAQRLGERCTGGMAGELLGNLLYVACMRPGNDGHLMLLQLDLNAPMATLGPETRLAAIGPGARGVAIAARNAGLSVLFHDAGPEAHRISLSSLDAAAVRGTGPAPLPTLLSKPEEVASGPALHVWAGKLFYAYVRWDLRIDAGRAELVLRGLNTRQEYTLPLHHYDAAPALSSDAEGLLLTFRDRPTPQARIEHFVVRPGADLGSSAPPRRVGRSSGLGGPALLHCAGLTYAAAPIEHGSELYVIFHGLDRNFRALEPNHQCYATERSLVGVATACSGSQRLALVAEESDPSAPSAELFGMRFGCSP